MSRYVEPRSTATLYGRPIHAMLVPFPIVCFIGAFICDFAYWQSAAAMWSLFSVWLLFGGLLMGAFAALAGVIDFLGSRKVRAVPGIWIHAVGNAGAFGLSLINIFVHSRDGYTAVVPTGLILSGLVAALLLITSWIGHTMVYRYRVGVAV